MATLGQRSEKRVNII